VRRTLGQFPDVVSSRIDIGSQRAILQVEPSFDQYVALEEAIEAGGGVIRMFHTRYVTPQPIYAALGLQRRDSAKLDRLQQRLQAVAGVRSVFIDPERWFRNEQGLDVGGAVVFADPSPSLSDRLILAGRSAGFLFEPKMHEQDEMAERQWSETNHRFAGLLLLLLSCVGLLQTSQKRVPALLEYGTTYVWFGLFVFLFVRADANYWPLGPLNWWAGFRDPEALPHRLGTGLLIPIIVGDFLRIRNGWRLNPSFGRWGILVIGAVGSTLLFRHLHQTLDPAHYAMVQRMNAEHIAMAAAVLLFATSKFVWETWKVPRRWGQYHWLVWLGILGVMLNMYVE
jgi:hypothetical protein